jgi:prepilin-type N-terminal cleavage/methylation domain-containing protein
VKKTGFTLAEVLITLGIIGIVAALTIPALVADYQEKSWETAKKVFENRISEAVRIMNLNENFAGYTTTEAFVDALVKELKVIKICKTNAHECFSAEVTNGAGTETVQTSELKTASDFGRDDYNTKIVGLTLVNGYNVLLAYDPNCPAMEVTAPASQMLGCLSMVYDINGKSNPNKSTKDIVLNGADGIFNTCSGTKLGGLCVGGGDVSFGPINTCDGTSPYDPYFTSSLSGTCVTNYWAGAVKACQDSGMRLPSKTELVNMWAQKSALGMIGSTYFSNDDITQGYAPHRMVYIQSAAVVDKGGGVAASVRCVK